MWCSGSEEVQRYHDLSGGIASSDVDAEGWVFWVCGWTCLLSSQSKNDSGMRHIGSCDESYILYYVLFFRGGWFCDWALGGTQYLLEMLLAEGAGEAEETYEGGE